MYFVYFVVALVLSLLSSCSQPTDSPNEDIVVRERILVSGSISEDTAWESGKEYFVTGDVTVETGVTLTIQPDGMVKFAHERADDYYGITVEGKLVSDGGDSTTAILFTSGAEEWARKPGDWRGIEVEASSDSSSVIRYCRIEYANVGIKADGSSLKVDYCVVEQCADTGILFYGSDWGEVAWCTVVGNRAGIRFENVPVGKIEHCVLEHNEERGIECRTSSLEIRDNRIYNNGWGIYCSFSASSLIEHNDILYQTKVGIVQMANCKSVIRYNRIIQSKEDGIHIDWLTSGTHSVPKIEWNSILVESPGYAVRLGTVKKTSFRDIEAIHNYWGTADRMVIVQGIYDVYDSGIPLVSGMSSHGPYAISHSKVLFEPFLMEPPDGVGLNGL